MPKCNKCRRPIFFLSEMPNQWNPRPKMLPIDLNPSTDGTVSLYDYPGRVPGSGPTPAKINAEMAKANKTYFRRQDGEALKLLRRNKFPLYRIHFDTCTGWQPAHPR